jgi:hypothetical protein
LSYRCSRRPRERICTVQVSDDARVCAELAGYRTESLRALPEIAIEAVVVVVVRGAAERV